MALFSAAIKRDSVSLLKFSFLSHVQIFSCEISLACRLKCPYNCFSSHFLSLGIVQLIIVFLFLFFLWGGSFKSRNQPLFPLFHIVFESSYRCIDTIFTAIETSFSFFYYGFRRNRSMTSQILTIRRILEGVRAKNLQATLIFVDFTKAFDSIHRGKMEQILLAYGIPKETVAAITILYRNTKVKVRSPNGDTEYFDIVAGVL